MHALVLIACYFTQPGVSADCAGLRDEAEDYLAKSHQACAAVIYVGLTGTRETVRCRGYDNSVIDYISDTSGNLKIAR